ncbi:DNA repair protein RecO [Streptococcus loxodontisalivarius]|uniref:DNA repair protein RecO n=1 Tax=Streptococcus loxodontisalivarius TaxID=1349415 RepID=A0ABS2PTH4_9STRE|nr:DNA repair protein RecO [Streptococcus loxodontisalivarius]MBM7643348.1 DNA repair protein RecO (recombination protein O) [Streptococcus loxodontisalivarius]
MQTKVSKGLVLYNRNFREDDKLVKIFTESSGKRMFFVKHASKSKLASVIQPLTVAEFIMKISDSGLSYIEDYREVSVFKAINEDIFKLSYATYIVSLADAAVNDNQYDPHLFDFLVKTLELMEQGLDYEILTNIFEVQILERFGVQLNFHECAFCHRVGLPFDFSFKYSGLLCPDHYHQDEKRSFLNPNVPYLLDRFQTIKFDDLQTISVNDDLKREIRLFLDAIYDDYVGIHLKSKKFIDDLGKWGQIMKS